MGMKTPKTTYEVELSSLTVARIRRRNSEEWGETDNAFITKLLDETCTTITVEEFLDQLVDACDPVQIAIYDAFRPFQVVIHPKAEPADELFEDVDAIEVDGEPYVFDLKYDHTAPQATGRTTIYSTTPLTKSLNATDGGGSGYVTIGPVDVQKGVDKVRELVKDQDID